MSSDGITMYMDVEFIQNNHIAWDREHDCGPELDLPMNEGK